jgi:hypothetical protein
LNNAELRATILSHGNHELDEELQPARTTG